MKPVPRDLCAWRPSRHILRALVTEKGTRPLSAEHPLTVGVRRNQQETASPSRALGGDLTPIDMQRGRQRM